MTWIKLDDKFHRNHKQRAMSDNAFRLFILALSYCGDCPELTGFLTTAEMIGFARSHGKKPFVVDELVRRGFLEVVSDGFLVHDWEKFVPKTSTERVRKWREQKRSESVTETFQERSRNVSPLARTRRVPEPEPVPVPEDLSKTAGRGSIRGLDPESLGDVLPSVVANLRVAP